MVSDLTDIVKQLKTQTSTSNLATPASADNLGPAFGFLAITAIPNFAAVNLNLTDKHILWTPVTLQVIKLTLPIDSCCSISLISKNRANALLQPNSIRQFTPLDQPLTISVANLKSQLYATGILPVPTTWPNGQNSTF